MTVNAMFARADEGVDIYHPLRSPIDATRVKSPIRRTVFHLVNWPRFSGPEDFILVTGTPPQQSLSGCGRLTLKVDGWSITIVEVDEVDSLLRALKCKGGYVISHVGVVERDDGSSFTADEVDSLFTILHCYFSFALGRWAGPQLPVGYDATGNKIFENWGFGPLASGAWNGDASWFDERHSELLQQVLPGFCDLWKKEVWQQALHEVIYWYVGASRIGSGVNVDSALLFTQAALERLAWTHCVLDRRMVSKDAFRQRGLRAADKLRILASNLDIPLDIPDDMKSLQSKSGRQWVDSMDAITDLRNGLVHPDKSDEPPEGAYYEAWRLSLWYIDMILLRLCGYCGKYGNRLSSRFVGIVEAVPWAKSEPVTTANGGDKQWMRPGDYC